MPVELVDNGSTISSTELALPDNYGCTIKDKFYAEGAQVPSNPNKPCELCYCIRNVTTCVMQECTLHIDGCQPIYNKGVCCPIRYSCGWSHVPYFFTHHFYKLFFYQQNTILTHYRCFKIMTTQPLSRLKDSFFQHQKLNLKNVSILEQNILTENSSKSKIHVSIAIV